MTAKSEAIGSEIYSAVPINEDAPVFRDPSSGVLDWQFLTLGARNALPAACLAPSSELGATTQLYWQLRNDCELTESEYGL